MTEREPMVIDMVSDPICPWCYVGFRALAWASMALSFEVDLTIRYRPYRLDPETPAGGRDRHTHLAKKFPDPAVLAQMNEALKTAMQDVGVSFDPRLPARIPDTTDAHRLLRWAHLEGVEREVMTGLFEAYWHHGEDLSTHDVLGVIAEGAGMERESVLARLATSEDRSAVVEEAADFRAGGVDGVPTFIVNEQAGFAGALPKEQLLEAFRQLAHEVEA